LLGFRGKRNDANLQDIMDTDFTISFLGLSSSDIELQPTVLISHFVSVNDD